jgi:4-hydroxybutyryl-CoA dehydratase/vinylacetyl-CoA-Delta-isomerase
MKKEDRDYAVAFAVPTDSEGMIHIYGRNPGDTRKMEKGTVD